MIKSVKLSALCKMQSGGTPSRSNLDYYEGDFPWAKISDLEKSDDGYIYKTEEHITQEALQSINNRQFQPGTLLLAMYGSVGKTAITKIHLTTNQAILGINIIDDTVLDIKYLKYWFSTIKGRLLNRAVGAALPNISLGIVKDLEIPLPPLPQQQKIANILDAADAIRQNDKALIAKYDELTQALFLDMFGDPVSNPKGWEIKPLGKVCKIQGGYSFKSTDFVQSGVKLVKIANVNFQFLDWEDVDLLPMKFIQKYPNFSLKEGDILMALTRPIIKSLGSVKAVTVKKNDLPALLNQRVARFFPKTEVLSRDFLLRIIYSDYFKNKIEKLSSTSLQPNVSNKQVENIEIFLPPLELQNQFAKRVAVIEEQKAIAQKSLEHSESLFNSLLQKAFKGELV